MEERGTQEQATSCFQLKGGLVPMTTLELFQNSIHAFEKQLKKIVNKAPQFFKRAPVILALDTLNDAKTIPDFAAMRILCSRYGLSVVAIRGGTELQKEAAAHAGLAWLPPNRRKPGIDEKTGKVVSLTQGPIPQGKPIQLAETIFIEHPVRSGQQVHSRGDLVVLAPVSAGAELLAEGSIHVYAPLRGRVLAGIKGNGKARIFCAQFEAELVSISGNYKLAADMAPGLGGKAIQIQLEQGRLRFDKI